MEEKPASPMKKFTKLVTHTSFQLLDSFLKDTEIEAENARIHEEFIRKLQKAAFEKSLVVLQVKTSKLSIKHETIAGWINAKSIENGRILIRLQEAEQQLRMVPISQIQRITVLTQDGDQERLIR